MKELESQEAMSIEGGGMASVFFCIVIGTALYKVYRSAAGRISIPRLISFEWR